MAIARSMKISRRSVGCQESNSFSCEQSNRARRPRDLKSRKVGSMASARPASRLTIHLKVSIPASRTGEVEWNLRGRCRAPASADMYSRADSRTSPKVGLAYAVNAAIELYGNWGQGFHSNDARGVVNPTDPVPGLSPGEGYEAGARFELGAVNLTSAYWWLNLDSELIFVGDSNSVEPKGGSRRAAAS